MVHVLLPAAVRLLREELQLLQEPGSYVGEVIKVRRVVVGCKEASARANSSSMVVTTIRRPHASLLCTFRFFAAKRHGAAACSWKHPWFHPGLCSPLVNSSCCSQCGIAASCSYQHFKFTMFDVCLR